MLEENVCSNCLKQSDVHLVCLECSRVQLCIPCYCYGAESGMHKKNHGYRIARSTLLPNSVLEGWSSEEELNLLEALEQYGIGNWEDIAIKVETKSADECMRHYCNRYLNEVFGLELLNDNKYSSRITDHTNYNIVSSPVQSYSTYIDIEDQQLLGYMPNRGDFERDYDNDAESILCRLHPSFSHDDLEDALKVAQVNIYMQRLRERQRRKEIACEHSLIPHILAFILNKRVKKRAPVGDVIIENTPIKKRPRGRPPSANKLLIQSKLINKTTPVTRISNLHESVNKDPGKKPPPNSWLAAPFILQSSGPTKGAPIIVNTPSDVTSDHHMTNECKGEYASTNCKIRTGNSIGDFNGFYLNEKLKPFLRYFTGMQGKHFIENLYKEELLKHEIKYLLELRAKGRTQFMSMKIKFPLFKSSVYHHLRNRSITDQPAEQTSITSPGHGNGRDQQLQQQHSRRFYQVKKKRRRHTNTPWYMKVQRRVKQYK
ncbi:unnamed protein product [Trichobilharzia szidati]|nr:unnamed protein product [Trichobilharzia szidati]